jgi:5-methylcytosine-specific restriction endonuclease McrA
MFRALLAKLCCFPFCKKEPIAISAPILYATPVVKQKSVKTKRKKDVIPKKVRDNVWLKYHGNSESGICYCCGSVIQRYHAGWHCSHVISDVKGGSETIENLRTCCRHCNLSMGNQNLYAYMKEKNMTGPGEKNIESYFAKHPDQIGDKRTTSNRQSSRLTLHYMS